MRAPIPTISDILHISDQIPNSIVYEIKFFIEIHVKYR